jgi:hypothetical protein|tara:strand:- start:262 stop:513 length:252 start_codon:yes stop_codon:yes gene_type:complete
MTISLKEFMDLEESSAGDVYQDHMKVMKDLAGGMSSANLAKLERTVKASKNSFLIKRFNDFKKAHLKAKQQGQFFTRAIEMYR